MQTRMQSLSSAAIVPGASSLMRKTVNLQRGSVASDSELNIALVGSAATSATICSSVSPR